MLHTRTLTPADQIAEARWWVAELLHGLPPGCTPRLLRRARFWLFDLLAEHHAGRLQPLEYVADPDCPF